MKNFLARLLLYVLLMGVIVFVLAHFDSTDRNSNNDHNVIKISHMADFDSLDILFIGNSYCYSSIYTPLFDSIHVRAFNLGIATAGPRFYNLLLDDYLSVINKQPDTVMMLVSPMTFSMQADDWKDYPIHRYLNRPLSNESVVIKYEVASDYFPMLFNSVRKGLNNVFSRQKFLYQKDLDKIVRYKGLFVDSSVTSDSLENSIKYLFNPLKKDRFDKKATVLLTDLADRLEMKGIKVLFFETPTHNLNNYFSAEFLSSYDEFCRKLSGRYTFFRNDLHLDSRYFRNTDHTNTQGAYLYTTNLIANLYRRDHAEKISIK